MLDFHNHLMPGVDDGAQTEDEARRALRALSEQGIDAIITTPHLDGSLTADPSGLAGRLAEFDAAWSRLRRLAEAEFPNLDLRRGAEIKLDSPEPDLTDDRIRLAGTRFALVEFPHMMVPPRSARVLFGLAASGWTPIIAHPERYSGIDEQLDLVVEWRRVGAHLQVNAGSVVGRYGPDASRAAMALLRRGWVAYLSSDYHARGRPHVRACRDLLLDRGAEEHARLLLETNPRRILEGEPPIPVPPLPSPRGFLARLLSRLRGAESRRR